MKPGRPVDLSPLVIALDTPELDTALKTARSVREHVDVVKVGLELFSAAGTESVKAFRLEGFEVFLDLKLMDIPNTVASACRALCALEPFMITLHTMGGQEMMRAAVQAVEERCGGSAARRPLLIGVTVLTSLDVLALKKIGVADPPAEQVLRLARLATESGMDGVVASPLETVAIRREIGAEKLLVTPGIRPAGAAPDDQKRVATPAEAVRDGADFLVVGRPLTRADDPRAVARGILEEIAGSREGMEAGGGT